ncbi:YegP family protein [Bradyrhizobium erythrophlei]|uniref:YegP family protein n=1 Tax=Bradyrhizobium erythrophlei TaxID=1437360 RepID=UPI0035E65B3D
MFFYLYEDKANQWRWALFAPNDKKIADSGEGYWNKADAQRGIELVKGTHHATPVYEQ